MFLECIKFTALLITLYNFIPYIMNFVLYIKTGAYGVLFYEKIHNALIISYTYNTTNIMFTWTNFKRNIRVNIKYGTLIIICPRGI